MSETLNEREESLTHIHSIPFDQERHLQKAACIGTSPSVFDADTYPQAWNAIKVCSSCPRNTAWACLQKIAPHKSWFDGVAGGMVWKNGIVQTITGKTLHLNDKTLGEYFDERNPIYEEMEE